MVAVLEYMLRMPPVIGTDGPGEVFGSMMPKTSMNALGNGPLGLFVLPKAGIHPDEVVLPPPGNLEVTEIKDHRTWVFLMEVHAGSSSRIGAGIQPPLILGVAALQGLGEGKVGFDPCDPCKFVSH